MFSAQKQSAHGLLLGRGGGLLLVALGLTVLCLLFWATQGHRARLAAEGLGVLMGGGLTLAVVGLSRPSAQVVTRAYVRLSRHTRALLIVGISMVFGFALVMAAIEPAMPRLRETPAFGGLITLDWVLSLTVLAVAGAMLLLLGVVAVGAHPANSFSTSAPAAGHFLLERLAYASNSGNADLLRACFTADGAGERTYREWRAVLAAADAQQAILVHSATVWGRLWSEWHLLSGSGHSAQQWILVAQQAGGQIDGADFFRCIVSQHSHS